MTRPLLIAALLLSPLAARAETHATCVGFIDSVPAVINTQGTWCLRHDLSTAITSGYAIEVTTNNVTIDCNSFKLGGLAAGPSSQTMGIRAVNRQNITVRNCSVRGFHTGLYLPTGAGHLLEDNRVDNSLEFGIYLTGEGSLTRRNRVFDTGGAPGSGNPTGIAATGDIIDNVVSGVFTTISATHPFGIVQPWGSGGSIQNNRVSGLVSVGGSYASGIRADSSSARLQGNHVTATAMTNGFGVEATGDANFCLENTVSNFQTALEGCAQSVGNLALP